MKLKLLNVALSGLVFLRLCYVLEWFSLIGVVALVGAVVSGVCRRLCCDLGEYKTYLIHHFFVGHVSLTLVECPLLAIIILAVFVLAASVQHS
jgi:hypothetical protein